MAKTHRYKTPSIESIYQGDLRRYKIPKLEEQEKKDLVQRAKNGDVEAFEKLARSHAGLIDYFANLYRRRSYKRRLPDYMDLVQEGFLVLFDCVRLYNPDVGDFTPYIQGTIGKKFRRIIAEQRNTIRINQRAMGEIRFIEELIRSYKNMDEDFCEDGLIHALAVVYLKEKTGVDPTPEEIQEHLLKRNRGQRASVLQRYRTIIEYAMGGRRELSIEDVEEEVEDTGFVLGREVERGVERANGYRETVNSALRRINPVDSKVVELRHELKGEDEYSLKEVGDMFDPPITGQRVHQLEKRGLKDLKALISGKAVIKLQAHKNRRIPTDSRIKKGA